ncbi:hypothetical protein BDA99DRAFT_515302 [Phascolomyces articulosus]|uniref:Glycosyltransferase family 32 protein n=1 Tax=Phascolomyces articulosus TaxID=60185 RepID=A0AAD5PCJ5_9FUNG|nr:hypothetical protein BDA99DRAFT_515302 [Phascolomyces articulosus]
MPPSTPFTPRRPSSRLPFYHPYTKSNSPLASPTKRYLTKRWLLRCLVALFFLYLITRPFAFRRGQLLDTSFPELSIAKNTRIQHVTTSKTTAERIPKIVHFIHGLKGPDPTLDLAHYIAIKAAHDVIQPDIIYLHYHYEPVGELFERARPMLTLRKVPLIDNIFGRPIHHFAHRADVVRLEALRDFGGIYFDLDLFALKPIDHLLDHEFVMGQEGKDGSVGLCNAMMMSRPNSRFIQRYYASYATFDLDEWNYHSVILPGKLAPHFPDEITILGYKAFFWPLWDSVGLRTAYLEKSYDYHDNLGTHIWESPSKKHLMKDATIDTILNVDNSLYCKVRPFLLDGKPDPRPEACRILEHTERADQLVGHWPLEQNGIPETNPMRADDISGNQVSGLIRNGYYGNDGVHLTGDDSYIFLGVPTNTSFHSLTVSWWMKPFNDKENGTAVVVQTDRAKIYVQTQAITKLLPPKTTSTASDSFMDPVSLDLNTVILEDDWAWRHQSDMFVPANPFPINNDDKYHHFVLVIDTDPKISLRQWLEEQQERRDPEGAASNNKRKNKKKEKYQQQLEQEEEIMKKKDSIHPELALYMDGHAIASSAHWKIPKAYGQYVRGVWFGSSEPEHSNYQDPWDTTQSLKAAYRDIRIWERPLSLQEIQALAPPSFANAPFQDNKMTQEQQEQQEREGGNEWQTSSLEEEGTGVEEQEEEDGIYNVFIMWK